MTQTPTVPFIPDNAPFTPAQRAWLNGFLAGLYAQAPSGNGAAAQSAPAKTKLSVLFGSQSGYSESLTFSAVDPYSREPAYKACAVSVRTAS
jgi:sulfite reductase (NADPH) flavoprotein alpha-component